MKFKSKLITLLLVAMSFNLFAAPAVLSYMEINGLIGGSYQYTSNDDTTDGNLYLNNFDLSLTLEASDFLSANVSTIYDDSMDYMEVDEAYAKLRIMEEYPLNITLGKLYLPTNVSLENSNFITDPMTYTFSEMQDIALMADFTWYHTMLSASFYKEDEDSQTEDTNIDAFVLNLAFAHDYSDSSFMLSTSYISNLYNASLFEGMQDDQELSAMSIATSFNWQQFSLFGEYIMTLDEYEDEKPSALHVEAAFQLVDQLKIAGQYGMSQKAEGLLNETTFGGIVNYKFMENSFSSANLALEQIISSDYQEETTNTTSLKLTYEF